ASAGARLRRPAASVLDGLPPDAPAGDKEAYIDALIARARALLGADGFCEVLEHSLVEMLADIRGDLAEFGVVFDHWTSERADTCTVRRARSGSAPPGSATRRTASWCARTARRPTSPPTSPITSPSASAASRVSSTCWAPIITAMSRGCAQGSSPWASRASA